MVELELVMRFPRRLIAFVKLEGIMEEVEDEWSPLLWVWDVA